VKKGDPHVHVGGGCQTFVRRGECKGSSPSPQNTNHRPAKHAGATQCWEPLTEVPGQVAAEEGAGVGQSNGSPEMCGAACDADANCNSFATCPAVGDTCWLKDRAVHKGDPHVDVGAGCQTFVRVGCDRGELSSVQFLSTRTQVKKGQVKKHWQLRGSDHVFLQTHWQRLFGKRLHRFKRSAEL